MQEEMMVDVTFRLPAGTVHLVAALIALVSTKDYDEIWNAPAALDLALDGLQDFMISHRDGFRREDHAFLDDLVLAHKIERGRWG